MKRNTKTFIKKNIEAFQTKVLFKQVHIIAEDVAGEKRLNCLKKKKSIRKEIESAIITDQDQAQATK